MRNRFRNRKYVLRGRLVGFLPLVVAYRCFFTEEFFLRDFDAMVPHHCSMTM